MPQFSHLREEIEKLKIEIAALQDASEQKHIGEVATRLEGCNFAPPVITPQDRFLRLTKEELFAEVERIFALPEEEACALAQGDASRCDELRLQSVRVLLFYFKKLILLRQGDSAEWDEIDELYIHD